MVPRSEQLDAGPLRHLAQEFAERHRCPTLAWGVVVDGVPALTDGVGEVTRHSVYRIASMTKSFSAAATLALRDDGVLRLDDPVSAHAPELAALQRRDSAAITIRDLLTMTSGLPTDDPWADRHLDLTDAEFDRMIADGPLFAHPTGDAWEYSNFGFALLGRVVHRATGQRIQQIVTERLLRPLGLTCTTWIRPEHEDWMRPMRWADDRHTAELRPLADGLIAPMGGLWSTVADLSVWIAWLDDAFPSREDADGDVLRRSTRRAMQSPQRYVGTRTLRGVCAPGSYGFGLQVVAEPTLGTVITHSGGLPGYGSNMRWLPGRRIGAIALANVTYAPTAELTARLLDELHVQGLVPSEAVPVSETIRSTAEQLVELLNRWDDAVATRLCTTSLILDDGLDRRRAAATETLDDVGPLTITSIEPTSAAEATVHCVGDSAVPVDITFLLAPPSPPRVQSYEVEVRRGGDPGSGDVR